MAIGLTIGILLSLVFVAGFAAGAIVQHSREATSVSASDASLRDFLTAYRLVTQRSYFRPFDRQHLINAAINGMLSATGDPHTLYLSASENRVADTQLNGARFSGIGAIVVPDHGNLQIWAPVPGSPATSAGLRPGDIVTTIDGRPVSKMSGTGAISKIHGPAGTIVRLRIVRAHHTPFTITVKRANIPPITAYGRMLPHRFGYLQVMSFGDTTSHEVAEALSTLMAQRARAIILDLRGNPGGYVDAAQRVVSLFVSHGVVAYEEQSNKVLQPLPLLGGKLTTLPLVVLIDGGTASAAEITAAALHDDGRAVLLGTQTYGKGSMQSVYALADGSSIRITDRLWLTPKKRSIQGVGIRPDITVLSSDVVVQGQDDAQLTAAERYLLTSRRQ
jgi:carboxyl-terminal processing protease